MEVNNIMNNEDIIFNIILNTNHVVLYKLYKTNKLFRKVLDKKYILNLLSNKYQFPIVKTFYNYIFNALLYGNLIPVSLEAFLVMAGNYK